MFVYFYMEVVPFVPLCGISLINFAEHLSILLQNTFQYCCGTPLNISAVHLSVFLRTALSNFSEHLPVYLQSTFIYFCRKPSQKKLSSPFLSNIYLRNFWALKLTLHVMSCNVLVHEIAAKLILNWKQWNLSNFSN